MKLILAALAICLLGSHTACAPLIAKMGNGLTVIVEEDHSAELVALSVWARAGSGRETTQNNGVSHFIEHLIFSATARRKPGEMDVEIESLGAELNARTSRDWAHFDTTVSSRYLSKALDVLADAVTSPLFREVDIARERLVILDEIAKSESEPVDYCTKLLASEVFGSHPYSLPVEGTRASVKAISRDTILEHYRKYYVPGNMAVVLVGDIDAQRAVEEVGRAFQGIATAPGPDLSARETEPPAAQVNKFVNAPFSNDYLAVGFLGPAGHNYKEVCAMDLLLAHLSFGARSWMVAELQNRLALATDSQTDYLTQREPALIALVATAKPGSVDKAKGAVFAKIASLRSEGLPAENLDLAKRLLLGQFAFEQETFAGRANGYGFYFAVSEPQFASNYPKLVQAVTNEDVLRAAQNYLDPGRAVVLVVGQGGLK